MNGRPHIYIHSCLITVRCRQTIEEEDDDRPNTILTNSYYLVHIRSVQYLVARFTINITYYCRSDQCDFWGVPLPVSHNLFTHHSEMIFQKSQGVELPIYII